MEKQKAAIDKALSKAQKDHKEMIVTEVVQLDKFYEAEDYHQDFFFNNPDDFYCQANIPEKLLRIQSLE